MSAAPMVRLRGECALRKTTFPWKPSSTTADSTVATAALDTGHDQPPGLPNVPVAPTSVASAKPLPTSMPGPPKPALTSKTVLLLFSGPFRRPDGIA
eukprot:6014546-Pleurochrysis_carterae.AAC.1